MSDEIDKAAELTEHMTQVALANARAAVSAKADTGFCRNCDEPLEGGSFCDTDCRDDYERLRSPANRRV